jgi:hypothetical protein
MFQRSAPSALRSHNTAKGSSMKWASWTNAILGVWLILAPWAVGYHSTVPMTEDVLLRVSVLAIALWSANTDQAVTGPAWANMVLGVWIMIAPWFLGYRGISAAVANDVLSAFSSWRFRSLERRLEWRQLVHHRHRLAPNLGAVQRDFSVNELSWTTSRRSHAAMRCMWMTRSPIRS